MVVAVVVVQIVRLPLFALTTVLPGRYDSTFRFAVRRLARRVARMLAMRRSSCFFPVVVVVVGVGVGSVWPAGGRRLPSSSSSGAAWAAVVMRRLWLELLS